MKGTWRTNNAYVLRSGLTLLNRRDLTQENVCAEAIRPEVYLNTNISEIKTANPIQYGVKFIEQRRSCQ